MYAKIIDNQPRFFPYDPADLRTENPETSFPADISDETLASYGVVPVTATEKPEFDAKTQRPVSSVRRIGADWTQSWTLEQLPEETASRNIRAERKPLHGRLIVKLCVTFQRKTDFLLQ
jgi:hypothetical protein